ncbi:hypothetical protein B0O99DRAFT_616571 [Bisporella sp. PMI_857]|nr:hypothetical protein B0O99DRAFT_616571 [Bisporella sp. PMI_857]
MAQPYLEKIQEVDQKFRDEELELTTLPPNKITGGQFRRLDYLCGRIDIIVELLEHAGYCSDAEAERSDRIDLARRRALKETRIQETANSASFRREAGAELTDLLEQHIQWLTEDIQNTTLVRAISFLQKQCKSKSRRRRRITSSESPRSPAYSATSPSYSPQSPTGSAPSVTNMNPVSPGHEAIGDISTESSSESIGLEVVVPLVDTLPPVDLIQPPFRSRIPVERSPSPSPDIQGNVPPSGQSDPDNGPLTIAVIGEVESPESVIPPPPPPIGLRRERRYSSPSTSSSDSSISDDEVPGEQGHGRPRRHYAIQQLRQMVDPESVPEEHRECPICYRDATIGEFKLAKLPSCTPIPHHFCRSCLTTWLLEKTTCPTCRKDYQDEIEDFEEEMEHTGDRDWVGAAASERRRARERNVRNGWRGGRGRGRGSRGGLRNVGGARGGHVFTGSEVVEIVQLTAPAVLAPTTEVADENGSVHQRSSSRAGQLDIPVFARSSQPPSAQNDAEAGEGEGEGPRSDVAIVGEASEVRDVDMDAMVDASALGETIQEEAENLPIPVEIFINELIQPSVVEAIVIHGDDSQSASEAQGGGDIQARTDEQGDVDMEDVSTTSEEGTHTPVSSTPR